jgi:hypothetical protein
LSCAERSLESSVEEVAGPRDIGVSVGGFGGLAGAEYVFPIRADDSLRGVLFLDTGTDDYSLGENRLRRQCWFLKGTRNRIRDCVSLNRLHAHSTDGKCRRL